MSEHMDRIYIAPPSASSLIESLRGIGYSPATAIADIVDNSISANASHIDIEFSWNDNSQYIAIKDNGCGMTAKELFDAMRLGYVNPLAERDKDDLGRFGLGLKTAAFSLCRSLTVLTKRKGTDVSSLRWDLDYLASDSDGFWKLLERPGKEAAKFVGVLEVLGSGTIVVLEKLDRVITSGFTVQNFLDMIDIVEKNLSLIFHRFLEGTHPKLILSINNKAIVPIDPFMVCHPATQSTPEDNIHNIGGIISMRGYVLPPPDRLSPADITIMGDPTEWTEKQGFYIYRNKRLIVLGSWLGLGQEHKLLKEEACRLARIRLDIPNTLDVAWKLDIKKSIAFPPAPLRKRLLQLAKTVRAKSRKAFFHQAEICQQKQEDTPSNIIWERLETVSGSDYHISRKHPLVSELLANPEVSSEIEELLVILEQTISTIIGRPQKKQ